MAIRPLLLITLAAALLTTGCETTTGGLFSGTRTLPVLRELDGSDPALTTPGVILINSHQQLQYTDSDKLDNLDPNFREESMVVLALGERPTGGYRCRITSITRTADQLIIEGIATRPSNEDMVVQVLTYPFHAVMIPKTEEVEVESKIESK